MRARRYADPSAAAATLLDRVAPAYDLRTVHGRPVSASVDALAAAMRETPVADATLARGLLAVRTLGASLRADESLTIADAGDGEPAFARLAEGPYELVVGFVGRPWPGGAPVEPPVPADAFTAYEPVDSVKVAMSVRCAAAEYGSLLVTETRICMGPAARTPFRRYWLVVKPGSVLVRRSLLRAIADRAERPAP